MKYNGLNDVLQQLAGNTLHANNKALQDMRRKNMDDPEYLEIMGSREGKKQTG